MGEKFLLNIIAGLNKQLSKAQLKSDLKGIDNTLSVKVIAKLATVLSKKQLGDSLKQMNNLYVQVGTKFKTDKNAKNELLKEIEQLQKNITELQLKVGVEHGASKNVISSVISTAKTAQRYADKTSITLDIEVRKEKAVNDILYIGQRYSKLFSNVSASQKYDNLLNSAYSISDKAQLQEVRAQISAFTSDLKAHGLAVQSTGDKWRKLTERAKDLFSAASIVRMVFVQAKQAVSTTIGLDKVYTDLVKVNDELNRNDYADYLSRCNRKAQELATTQKALIEGATEFSKSGYDLSTSDALTEKSTILANVGDMTASDSAKAIISGVQAYNVVDGYTDVVDKADALISKYNEIGNTASITTSEIAQGVQKVGSVFADANTSVDKLIALGAAGNRQYQDADSLFLGLRTAALRIRGCSAELEAMGEETEGVYTSASKLAEKIEGLTNVNGAGGVKILEDDEETFRSIYDIFLDISKVYKDMSDTDASALLELIAGKNRASAISATLNNMTEAQEILQNSLNAAGSAQKEYNTYLESTEAHIQQFQAKLVKTYSTFINGDMISHASDLGSAMLDLVNSTDLLKHSLIAIATLKVGQGIAAVGEAISGTITQMNTLGNALQRIKSLPLDDDLRKEALDDIGEATKSLTEKNLKLLFSKQQLSTQDKLNILTIHGLTQEEALSKLEKMGLTAATNANTAANTANTGSVNTLKGAFTGLTASVKATWAAMSALQKASIIFAAISTAWSIGSSIINGIKQNQEELIQSTKESTKAHKESASSIEDYTKRYQELHKALIEAKGNEEETYNIKKQLLDLQTELNDKFGEEYGKLNLVTDAYKDQTQVIRELNKAKAQTFLNENREGIESATKAMTKERTYNLSYTGMSSETDDGAALKEIAEKYADKGIRINADKDTGTYNIILEADVQSAYDTINAFENDIREKAKEFEDEHIFDDVLEISSTELNNAKEVIDQYADIYKQALTAEIVSDGNKSKVYNDALEAVNAYNEAVLKSEDPYNDENVINAKKNLDEIKESIQTNEEEWGKYSVLTEDIFDQADTRLFDFNEKLKNDSGLKDLAKDLNGLSDIDLKALDENVGDNEAFDKLKANAEEYKVSVDELISTLVRLGYVQGEVQNSVSEIEVEASFDQVWADLVASEDDAVKELDADLLELAEKGRLTVDTFNEADSTGYFKNLGISADIAVSKINKLVDESKQLSSMSDQISKMSEALGTKKENGFVEADTLSSFDVEVRGLESWDKFQTVLGSVTSSYEECHEAANELATEWVNSSDFLAKLTEDTKEYYETQLESMGIENYEEVIESTLALKEAKEALADVDLSDASYEDIEALIAEGEYSALVTEQMWALYYAKLAESGTFLDSSADCAQLQALANDAMLTAEAVELLNQLIQIYNGLEAGAYNNNRALRAEAVEEASRIKSELENLAKGEGVGLIAKPELKVNGNRGKTSGGGSGSSKDTWKEAYDAELKELEHMHKLGLISDEEYWKARMDLNEKYFGESSGKHQKYLDEYRDNEEDILEGLKKLWEDYYNERKNNLKDLISYAEKLYDREIDSLEANIKQIEEKRDTEKKYWQGRIDAIGDEIDALEDANDQRERAIDLQEKQYQLQKAMHQRTILLYSESKGMHYVNDSKAERSAKNDLDGAENDNKIADLKKQQKDLEKQLDAILETYDSQIESIEKQIDSLKEVKSAWSEIVENQEFKELEERLKSLFGDDIKSKILSGNTDFINDIIVQYSDTSDMLRTIEDATLSDIQNMVAQYGILPENLVPISNAATDIANTLANVDTSGFNANMDNTAQSSSNAAEKVQNVTTALNNLSNDVANYQMPALNMDNFTSAFAEDGGILTALNGFMERYKEICDGIPDIWNNSLAEAFGQGGGNGDPLAGGLANDTKYDALFDPLVEALDNCKTNMEAKLKECLGVFSTFQTDLSGIIGVGGGSEDSGSSQPGTEGGKGKGSGKGNDSGGNKKTGAGGGSDTIVGAIVEGGGLIDQALNGEEDSWSASFNTAKDSIHETATSIVDCIESMVETVVDACIKAIEAINMLASADDNNPNNPTPSPYGKVGHAHAEGVNGTRTYEKNAIVSEYGQRELTVLPNGKTVLTDAPTAIDLPKGSVVYNEEQTEKILKNKVTATGNAYAKGTDNGNIGEKFVLADGTVLTPVPYDDPAYDVTRKFEAYMKKTGENIDIIARSGLIRYNREMGEVVKSVTNVSSITNNNRNVQSGIHVDKIEIMCPGVTSQQIVNEVSTALDKQFGHLSQRAMQEAYKR